MRKKGVYLVCVLFLFFNMTLYSQENRRNTLTSIYGSQPYNTSIRLLTEINAPDNYFNEFFLTTTNLDKAILSGFIERKRSIYKSKDNGNITITMTLFLTPQNAAEGLIAIAKEYQKSDSSRYFMPWEYNRMILIGDMFAVSRGAAVLFNRNNVVVDINADKDTLTGAIAEAFYQGRRNSVIEAIAEEIDWEICQGELDYIANDMAFENYNRTVQSLDEINLPEEYKILSTLWGDVLPKKILYTLDETKFSDTKRQYTYIESERENKIFLGVTLYPTAREARKRILMEVLKRAYSVSDENKAIGDISVERNGIKFSRCNIKIDMYSTAINPTHEVFPVLRGIDIEIMERVKR